MTALSDSTAPELDLAELAISRHEGHGTFTVEHSWGSTVQCSRCEVVVAAYGEDGPLDFVPSAVLYRHPA